MVILPVVVLKKHFQSCRRFIDKGAGMDYLDFDLIIGPGRGREYPLNVRSFAGEVSETLIFPFDALALENRLKDLQIALLRSGRKRQVLQPEEQAVQDFGRELFNILFKGEVRGLYDVIRREASTQGKGVRIKLRFQPPELAALPWEFLYDPRKHEYVCLSRNTPIIRYLEISQPILPIKVIPPLRILGMIASPCDLPALDVAREKQRIERAIQKLRDEGFIEITWLEGQTWRDLQRAMRGGPWHVFHFVGHGLFDANADEGVLALTDENGNTDRLSATQMARLLADHNTLRFVLLNSCEGGKASQRDIFSSLAVTLVNRGIPAVLAMQYTISDQAAIEFASSFYEALSEGAPVDTAVVEARKAISMAIDMTFEWGTPVLWMRSTDGVLFTINQDMLAEATARVQDEVVELEKGKDEQTFKEKLEQDQQPSHIAERTHLVKSGEKSERPRSTLISIIGFVILAGFGIIAGIVVLSRSVNPSPPNEAILAISPAPISISETETKSPEVLALHIATAVYQPQITVAPTSIPTKRPATLTSVPTQIPVTPTPIPTIPPQLGILPQPRGSCSNTEPPCTYTVLSGDSFSSIAMQFYGTWEYTPHLLSLNRTREGYRQPIRPGVELLIPALETISLFEIPILLYPECVEGKFPCWHLVSKNDTYSSIAEYYYGEESYQGLITGANWIYDPSIKEQIISPELTQGLVLVIPVKK
jgi:hypothetical protein